VVASKCSGKIFISDKNTAVQQFKPYLFQNGPLVQLYNTASDCKRVGNISGSRFLIGFSTLPSYYKWRQ